ncbi:MAG: hypothetical protein AAF282_20110 [Cyanobacteria bacterium P01_A01_bin.15]
MAKITIHLGDSFLIDTPPNKQHLYIAISKTSEDRYLFVNATSRRASSDTSCILRPGSGVPKFISCESVINYRYAREMNVSELLKVITKDSPIPKGTCSSAILNQIQKGGLASKRLKNRYKVFLKTYLGLT